MHVEEISGKSLTNIKSIFTESFSGDFIFGGEEGLAVFLEAYRKLKKKMISQNILKLEILWILTGIFQSILRLIFAITLKANRTNVPITTIHEVIVTNRKKSLRPQDTFPKVTSAAKANAIMSVNWRYGKKKKKEKIEKI